MAHNDFRARPHTNWDMSLTLSDEEAMVLDTTLEFRHPTTRVQVNVTFKDDDGVEYHASRVVKMRVRRD